MKLSKIVCGSVLSFVFLVGLSWILYDGYRPWSQFLSALGVGRWGFLFNLAVVQFGVSLVLFYGSQIDSGDFCKSYVMSFGLLTGLMLVVIGFFPAVDDWVGDVHNVFAIFYFLFFVPLHLLLAGCLDELLLRVLSVSVSVCSFIGLFVPGVNQFVFQKVIVLLELLFYFLWCRK